MSLGGKLIDAIHHSAGQPIAPDIGWLTSQESYQGDGILPKQESEVPGKESGLIGEMITN